MIEFENFVKSEGKLKNFNDCPGEKLLNELQGWDFKYIDVIDKSGKYWKNDDSTLVLGIECDTFAYNVIDLFIKITNCYPDEVDMAKIGDMSVVRFWWD